ncbi:MAG: thiamine pyrophosphate-binding protein [Armatimonadota bacterium]|nr:thiamine pyrophosphate-binding protein [Armatimonadota bacterium]MDR7496546.1 thiamine pyrophosphate-binding protein [Armatimonadota bacterium]
MVIEAPRGGSTGGRPLYGSDLVVDVLRALGVEYAALNPGATFRGLHDSLVNYGGNRRPQIIQCCHEEIAVAVAHGYAKAAGRPMAAIVHDVVGLQHASMAIFNAWCDRVPLLVLGGTGPMAAEQRRPWIDWIHTALVQGQAVRDYVKWDDQPASLAAIPEAIVRGYRIATTEPCGPVYVCLDAALQEAPLTEDVPLPDVARHRPPTGPQADSGALEEAARLLAGAQRPVIVAEFLGRHPQTVPVLVELAEALDAPVVDLYAYGRFNFPNTHPLDLTDARLEVLEDADVVLALDVADLWGRLARTDRATRRAASAVPATARIVDISLRDLAIRSWAMDYQRLAPIDLPIIADTSAALPALLELVRRSLRPDGARRQRRAHLEAVHHAARRAARAEAERVRAAVPIAPARLAAEVWDAIKGEDWVLVYGTLDGWARRLWDWAAADQYLGYSGGAGLGYGPGASVGAALAHRDTGRLCVALQPDGDLLYAPSALWTAAHHRLPVAFVLCNNRSYYNDEVHQELVARARGRPVENSVVGIRLEEPAVDFAGLARALGVHSEGPVVEPAALGPALRRAVRVAGEERAPALVDVVIDTAHRGVLP